jgi:hypothetical protein
MSGIPTTGAVTMTALNTNFSGGNSLSGYRNKTIYDSSTNAATTIAASGAISFSQFRGKRALAPPGAIATAPVISLLTTTGARVTWSVSANATSYVLSIGTTQGATNTYAATNVGNATSATIGAVFLGGTSYFASVYGVNAAGNGTANQNPTAYILCAAPTNVALTVSSLASWTITWTAAPFATGYSWALSTSSTNATSIYTGTTSGVTTGAQTSSLSSSTLYYAFVYATRTESRSVYGSGSFTTPSPPTVTAAVPTASGNTITYTWTVSGASSFTVILYKTTSTAASGGSSVATATTGTSATFTMTASGFYYIIITAQNSIAVQSTATSASALSATYTAPPVATANTPTGAVLPYTQLVSGGTFPAAGTRITLINTGTVNWITINITLGGANKLIDNGITYDNLAISTPPNGSIVFTMPNLATYFEKSVYVEIYNGVGSGIKITNNSGSITYFSYVSNGQSIFFSMNTGGPLMTYTWSGTNSPTGYTVNLYASGNQTALATLTNTTATSATYVPVGGTTYYTTVTATNAAGTSAPVQSANFLYVAPPIATAATPTVATVPYSVITGSSTYPTPGITITAINTGTLNWASLQVYYTSGQFNYIRTGPATTAPGGKYSFTMPTVGAGYSLILNAGVGAPSYATGYKEFKKSGSSIIYTSNDTTGIISVNTGGGLGLTYTWGASSGNPTGYTVNLYSTAAPSTPLATLTNTTTTSATYPAVSGTSYYITVIATNATGNSNTVTSGTVTA